MALEAVFVELVESFYLFFVSTHVWNDFHLNRRGRNGRQ